MKPIKKASNPINTMEMDNILKPLEAVKQVNAPFFLRDKINAKINRVSENITPRAAVLACASMAVLFALTVYSANNTNASTTTISGIDLVPHNDLYGQP